MDLDDFGTCTRLVQHLLLRQEIVREDTAQLRDLIEQIKFVAVLSRSSPELPVSHGHLTSSV